MCPQPSTLDAQPSISVIICTYNRAESLRRTLQTCCDLTIPEGVAWELLVVDNNSTDHTKQVCDSFTGKLPLRYIFEPRQGKSHALNTAVCEARGKLLLFTDDDVFLDRHWLHAIYEAAQTYSDASFFAGKILPHFVVQRPRWFLKHACGLLAKVAIFSDPGPPGKQLQTAIGANMAVRRSVFVSGVRYRTDVGPCGGDDVRGEETYLTYQLSVQGHRGVAVPNAVVQHWTAPSRMTEAYIRKWFYCHGIAEVRLREVPLVKLWFRVPRYYWRVLVTNALLYACARWLTPSELWLKAEISMAHAWGVIQECRRTKGQD